MKSLGPTQKSIKIKLIKRRLYKVQEDFLEEQKATVSTRKREVWCKISRTNSEIHENQADKKKTLQGTGRFPGRTENHSINKGKFGARFLSGRNRSRSSSRRQYQSTQMPA